MVFWVVAGILTFGVILLLLWPVLSAGTGEDEPEVVEGSEALAVYRDQLKELDRDLEAGRLGRDEVEAARLEVQRRMLAADAERKTSGGAAPQSVRKRRLAAAVLVIFGVPSGALLTYVAVGQPDMPDLPFAARLDESGRVRTATGDAPGTSLAQPDVGEMIGGLEAKLAENPEDAAGWALLARSYMATGRNRDAIAAYDRALALTPDNFALIAARGEARVLAADGIVVPAAVADFEKVTENRSEEPRARYYLGLARRQAGDPEGALEWWVELEADSPADAPWKALVSERIDATGREEGIDVAALRAAARARRPAPSPGDVAAAEQMSPEDRAEMIRSMVDRLAERLEAEPDDLEGWKRLARAYGVLGQGDDAKIAWANVARLAPQDLEAQLAYARALFPPGMPESSIGPEFVSLVAHIRELAPDNPDGLFYGGLVALRDGDVAAAKELWSALLERIEPNSPARAMLERRIQALDG